jgi:Ca-activated chloride channel family protein
MRRAVLLVLSLTLLGVTAGFAGPVVAGEEPPGTTTEVDGRLVLVLDASGSMEEPAPGGGTRIEAARAALTDVVASLPDDAEVGMRVFGATVFSRGDKGACTDTQAVVPVGPLDRDRLTAEIARYAPYGETPIGNALKGAARDLGGDGKRTIVLLSDGEPTCAPDPCRVARSLHRKGVGLTVNVVGLDVNGAARRALRCVASAGGGTYYDVRDPDELAGSLVSVSVRSLREFSVQGTPVEGGTTERDAPPLEPGQYTDVIAEGETTHYYRVAKQPGWGLNVGATTRPPTSESSLEGFELELRTPDGASCGQADDKRTNALRERAIVSAGISYVPGVGRTADETCADAEELVVEVAYDGDGLDKEIELVVAEQPPVADVAALPPGIEDTEPFVGQARVAGEPQPVLGGASFHDAPLLDAGAVYADTLRPGEQLLYRVPVGWGQSARLTVTAGPDPLADEALGVQGNTMQMRAFTPYRQSLYALTYSGAPVSDTGFYNGVDPTALTFALAPVRLRNGELFDFYVDRTTLAGEYVFSVEMGQLDDDTPFAAPITLEVEVLGDVEGEPDFDGPAPALEPSASAEPSSEAPDQSDPPAADESSSDEQSGPGAALLAGAAGVVVLLAAGAVLLRRRSRTAIPGR